MCFGSFNEVDDTRLVYVIPAINLRLVAGMHRDSGDHYSNQFSQLLIG